MTHMMLRVVDTVEFPHGTNDNPKGVYFAEYPLGWQSMSEAERVQWCDQTADGLVPEGHSYVFEVVDADLPDYERELHPPEAILPLPEPTAEQLPAQTVGPESGPTTG